MKARCRVGTSGWNYKHWSKGVFYPEGGGVSKWLEYYSEYFDSVEINNSFYRLPEKKTFQKWHDEVPEDFLFSAKASRYFTHMKKLADPEKHAALFLERASALKEKLGVVLFQLPPFWKGDPERLEGLLDYLKKQKIVPGLRFALEIRNESWRSETYFELLRRYNVSLALTDWGGLKTEGPVTADFVFLRRHGPGDPYSSNYTESHLKRDARKIRAWLAEKKDVYIYFNNDAHGYAVQNALRLKELLPL